jgi:hypothetical protein
MEVHDSDKRTSLQHVLQSQGASLLRRWVYIYSQLMDHFRVKEKYFCRTEML